MNDKPLISRSVFRGLCAVALVLLALDLVHHRHVVHGWEAVFGFYSFYGFVACVALVLAARLLRTVVMRREDYYDAR